MCQVQAPGKGTYAREGWDDWAWRDACILVLLQNLHALEEELVKPDHRGRRDQVLMEALGGDITDLKWETVSAKVRRNYHDICAWFHVQTELNLVGIL